MYFHVLDQNQEGKMPPHGVALQFAPVRIRALLSTDYGHRQILKLGYYERRLSSHIARLAKNGGVLIDVGANIGYFTMIWLALNPCNRAYAFEPSRRNFSMLRENLLSVRSPERAELFNCALGAESGLSNFHLGPPDQTGWGGLSKSQSAVKVQVRRLDEVIPAGINVDVLKIDTEGADSWVIKGAERLLREKSIKSVYFEINQARMSSLGIKDGEAQDFLEALDYSVEQLETSLFKAVPNPTS